MRGTADRRGGAVAEGPAPGRDAAVRIAARVGEGARQAGAAGTEGGRRQLVGWLTMALATAGITEGLAGVGDEFPVVAVIAQRELQHAVCAVIAHLAVRHGGRIVPQPRATRADHELADPVRRVRRSGGALRREALVIVVVSIDDELPPR